MGHKTADTVQSSVQLGNSRLTIEAKPRRAHNKWEVTVIVQ